MLLMAQPAVRVFAFWYLLLVVKMLMLIFRTSATRMRLSSFASPEDAAISGAAPAAAAVPDERIERLRRALQNDLENILPFFGVGLIYALSGPSLGMARFLIGGFALARIAHTIFYVRGMQPHRSVAFMLGMFFLVCMVLRALWSVL